MEEADVYIGTPVVVIEYVKAESLALKSMISTIKQAVIPTSITSNRLMINSIFAFILAMQLLPLL